MTIQLTIDKTMTLVTKSTIIALFDPVMIEHRINNHRGWWQQPPDLISEVSQGEIAILKLRHNRAYTIHITSHGLSNAESSRVIGAIKRMGVVVKSSQLVLADASSLPGDDKFPAERLNAELGKFLAVPNGHYNISIYALAHSSVGDSHDIVITIQNRQQAFPGIDGITELFIDNNNQQDFNTQRLDGFDEFSEYERRKLEREGQEKIARNAGKLRNPADYLAQDGAALGQLFKPHIKFINQPTGEFKQPHQLSINEALDNAEMAPELANSPKLEAALAARANPNASPTFTRN